MVNFKAPYNKEEAVSFLGQFLPDDFQKANEEIRVDFKPQFIRHIRKIGEASSLENLHIYEITHESENDPRVSLSKDSFRLLAHFGVRKALIFFVSKASPNYRLSLVTVDLSWESGARVRREYSNPRRYSFFLGPDARVHTPYDFLIKKGQIKNTADLLSRFDVEIVTKEFFTKYKGLFEDVSGYLEKDHGFKIFAQKNDIGIDTFTKKLLGQIIFCYFLQRKGWLGAKRGEPINKGDKDFMRSLFNRGIAEKKNFYNDYLEYLFYGSLNNRAEGSSDFYRKHFDCQIPFLNGGLFEPPEDYDWEKSFVHIPDKLFSNKNNTGILDVFDLYNFTVYEDDPIDREVSVDPEMLGKVFENLLPENLRKGQGAYYTPREIVHYMCQESLINYLTTETKVDRGKIRDLVINKNFEGEGSKELVDRALQKTKVCDPACGSGAFLVGMLHEIVSARRTLNPKADEYHLKKEAIQNCIYGVDIDPGAVEIAKLRLWLSLVVDYELKDIEPLPNLDYKIMCGNSLLEEFEGVRFYDGGTNQISLFKDDRKQKIQELREKVKEYFKVYDDKEKRKKREEINKLKDWFIKATLERRRKEITRERKAIEAKADMFQEKNREEYFTTQGKIFVSEAKINEVLRELHNPQKARPFFIWKLEFMDVFEEEGGFDVVIANPPYIDYRKIDYLTKSGLFSFVAYHRSKTASIYVYFIELGCNLLKKSMVCCYINPYQYLIADSGIGIREFLIKNTSILKIIDISNIRVFQNAATYTCINIFKKEINEQNHIEIVRCGSLEDINKTGFTISQKTIKGEDYLININPLNNIILKIEKDSKALNNYCSIFCGTSMSGFGREIITLDQYNILEESKKKNFLVVKQSSDIKKYYFDKSISFINKKVYPENVINKFKKNKIFFARMTRNIRCVYSEKEYAGGKVNILIDFSISPKLLLVLLNSRLMNFWYSIKFESKHLSGGYLGFDIPSVEVIPIKIPTPTIQNFLTEKVESILELTQQRDYQDNHNKQSIVKEYERQIDQTVYKLYGLTQEEIKIVDDFNI